MSGTTADHLRRGLDSVPATTIALSFLPLLLTWIATFVIAQRRLFPALTGNTFDAERDELPTYHKSASNKSESGGSRGKKASSTQKLASLVFSVSIGLSAVLVELLLCEISNTLNPAARGLALRLTLGSLLLSNVLITPGLQVHGLAQSVLGPPIESAATSRRSQRARVRILFELAIFGCWLFLFWYLPQASILRRSLPRSEKLQEVSERAFIQACLERVGIIGISLMASLAGFAAVSSLWQTFGVRHRAVKESDVSQKEAGLAATQEMLMAKESRLRALQRKISESTTSEQRPGFVGRVVGSFRGNAESQELSSLQMEISGLETMRFTLSSSVSTLRGRFAEQQRSRTSTGRLLNVCNSIFAIYCAYRICATSVSSLRRWWQPSHSFATSDPINIIIALLTAHWDSELDQAAWTRQISFLLSGIILLASFNSVLQTFRLFARFSPSLVQYAQVSLPLIISQVTSAYVISSALLLSSNLPKEVSSVISGALGAPLDGRFVENWFESWFLVSVGLTATGILIGRKVGNATDEEWDDESGGFEMGSKRS